MDDGRVPIDLTEQHAPVEGDARSYVREDGSLVIDVLVEQPCGTSAEGEIVVCAPDQSAHRLNAPPEPPPKQPVKAEISLGGNAKLQTRTAATGQSGAPTVLVDLKMKF